MCGLLLIRQVCFFSVNTFLILKGGSMIKITDLHTPEEIKRIVAELKKDKQREMVQDMAEEMYDYLVAKGEKEKRWQT
jgi:hypothetical protein